MSDFTGLVADPLAKPYLSVRRAVEVVKQLVNKYQIDSIRLQPLGAGPLAPGYERHRPKQAKIAA
ncbi:hypothetical protein PAT01_32110 [Pseudoalteromonas atlantica]|uniref:Uncharacterized protein n=1 Tax=Pseudoalteromonas atlantica TaxID=288 RepID=A0ABQ0UHI2_PSEAF|nr:hypothetical protein PAT01_32110 [Pseudoalteromonas atlantica]